MGQEGRWQVRDAVGILACHVDRQPFGNKACDDNLLASWVASRGGRRGRRASACPGRPQAKFFTQKLRSAMAIGELVGRKVTECRAGPMVSFSRTVDAALRP